MSGDIVPVPLTLEECDAVALRLADSIDPDERTANWSVKQLQDTRLNSWQK